jgi:hypothetical protein
MHWIWIWIRIETNGIKTMKNACTQTQYADPGRNDRLKVVTNEKGDAVGEVVIIIC